MPTSDNVTTLHRLAVGASATVTEIDGEPRLARRLHEMGLTRGTRIRLVRQAPLGDPIEIEVRGYHLTLRRDEADHVRVEA